MTRFWAAFRTGRPLYYAAIGMLLLAAVIVIAVLEGDLPELFQYSMRNLRTFYAEHNYLPGYAALYIEESGVPLPAPRDVFVMYVGPHIPQNPVAWVADWFGLVLVVVLDSANLTYFLIRCVRRSVSDVDVGV